MFQKPRLSVTQRKQRSKLQVYYEDLDASRSGFPAHDGSQTARANVYHNDEMAKDFNTATAFSNQNQDALNNSQEILNFSADLNKTISDRAHGGDELTRRYVPKRPAPMAGNTTYNTVRPAIKFRGSPFTTKRNSHNLLSSPGSAQIKYTAAVQG